MMKRPLKTPDSITIAITGRCNLACQYCYYADEMVSLTDMPTASWLSFFEECRDAGVRRITVSGGEPFSRRDIWQLLQSIVDNKMRFGILTNGTLITLETAERLSAHRRRIDYIQVSVDGSKPETHDAIRGKESFRRTMRGIAALKEKDLPWTARVTVNKLNVYDLEATLHMLHEELRLNSFGVNEAFPRGAGQCNNSMLEMTPEERRLSFQVMQEFDRKYPGVAQGAQAGPLIMAENLDKVARACATGEFSSPVRTGYLTGCSIMWKDLAVLHDGTYVLCHQLPHIHFGKVGVDSLRDVWLNGPALAALRAREEIPLSSLDHCQGCRFQPYCTGGCPGVAYAMTNEVNMINPRDCYRAYVGEDRDHAY